MNQTIMSGVQAKVKIMGEDPYATLILNYFLQAFPKTIKPNEKQLLEILTTILVGDKNMRLGPVPLPESLVVIRKIIVRAMEEKLPIPISIAWGGKKAQTSLGVDIAEVAALQQLVRLSESIKMYYEPGLSINIRVEDIGAYWLYRHQDLAKNSIARYSTQMEELTEIITSVYDIAAIKESEVMDMDEYFSVSTAYSKILTNAIEERILGNELSMRAKTGLSEIGWNGNLPMEQVLYYIDRYTVMYPGRGSDYYISLAADYLAGSKARYNLNGRLDPAIFDDGSHIAISFVPPTPGAPVSMFNNTLYYRTIPESQGRTHISPWRAKGYLEIASDNSVKVKLASFNSDIINDLHPVKVVFENNKLSTCVDSDYLIKPGIAPISLPGFIA